MRSLIYVLIFFFIIFTGLNLLRLWGFGFAISDFGLFRQLIWNMPEGRPFQYTAAYPYKEGVNYLGYYHFSIIPVIAALPFYALLPFPETLCVMHILLICLPAPVIYKTCLRLACQAREAFLWSLLYLFNPITLHHALFSYSEMSYAPGLMALALYFIITGRLGGLIITSVLLSMVKEHYSISMLGFGIIWGWYHKSWKQGFLLGLAGLILSAMILGVIMPGLRDYTGHVMMADPGAGGDISMFKRYQWLAAPPWEVITALPDKLANKANLKFLYALFMPLIFLPFFKGRIFLLAAASDFLAIMLSDFPIQKSINLNYPVAIIPVLIIASCYSLKHFKSFKVSRCAFALLSLAALIFAVNVMYSPVVRLSLLNDPHMDWATGKDFNEAAAHLPKDAKVIADEASATLLAERKYISGYNQDALDRVDYIFIRLNAERYYFINYQNLSNDYFSALNLIKSPGWGVVYWHYPYVIFKKDAADIPAVSDLVKYLQVAAQRRYFNP